jgi:hypothetical protein
MISAVVIVDDQNQDSVAEHLAFVLSDFARVDVVPLSAFLLNHGVKYNPGSGLLDWSEVQELALDPEKPILFNRVVEIGRQCSNALLQGESGSIPSNFVSAAYAEILRAYPLCFGRPGLGSPVGDALPLNLQWHAVSRNEPVIRTPTFIYGFGAEPVDVSHFRQPIMKSVHDLFNWQFTGEIAQGSMHPFVVDRPAGSPVLGYFVGDEVEVYRLGPGEPELPISSEIASMVRMIKALFRGDMGEMLFFEDCGVVTFAAFSHHLRTSLEHPEFDHVLRRGISAWLQTRVDAEEQLAV